MNAADALVLTAFASLALELIAFPIPSEASTWQLLAARHGEADGAALLQAQRQGLARKLFVFLLPTSLGVALFLLPLCAALGLPFAGFVRGDPTPGILAAGALLVVAGRALTFASVLQLRAQQRRGGGPPAGLFRRSRNPGLVGMYAFYLGLCCLYPHWLLWLGFPLYVANMTSRVRLEEAHLSARHGDDWQRYAAAVPRYLGRRAPSAPSNHG